MMNVNPQILMSSSEKNTLVEFYRTLKKLGLSDQIDYEGFLMTLEVSGTHRTRSQGIDVVIAEDEMQKMFQSLDKSN